MLETLDATYLRNRTKVSNTFFPKRFTYLNREIRFPTFDRLQGLVFDRSQEAINFQLVEF